eukprot:SM000124S25923  [mRNA]  locus=s124:89921:93055:+ [translate_table: standard]
MLAGAALQGRLLPPGPAAPAPRSRLRRPLRASAHLSGAGGGGVPVARSAASRDTCGARLLVHAVQHRQPSAYARRGSASKSSRATVVEAATDVMPRQDCAAVPPPFHPTYDIHAAIQMALNEDLGDRGDVTCLATIPAETQAEARFLAKASGILAGRAVADLIFHEVDPTLKVDWSLKDGDALEKGTEFGVVQGSARSILVAERVVLNFMQRMSGIATATKVVLELNKAMATAAKPARLLETRKTVPGLRLFDKWAVLIGGGENHRMGLFDMMMIKDNHIAAAGGVSEAIAAARKYLVENKLDIGVEVETRTLEEVREAMECVGEGLGRVTRLLLDNMVVPLPNGGLDVSMLERALEIVGGQVETEASGNVTMATVQKIGATGVTFISSGALTHSVTALDISLNIDAELALAVGKRTQRA